MFHLYMTVDVLAEAVSSWRDKHPTADGGVTRDLFDKCLENFDEVLSDFDSSVEFSGSDPHDRHVHAATIACRADILLTGDTRDFGDLDELPYEILTPDELFCKIDDDAPHFVRNVTREQNAFWSGRRNSDASIKSLEQALVDAGCPKFALRVRARLRELSGV